MIAGIARAEPVMQTRLLVSRFFFSYLSEIKPQEMLEMKPQRPITRA